MPCPSLVGTVHSYTIFGLCLKSQIAIPELIEGEGDCDVSIRFGKADLNKEIKASGSFFRATKDEIQFNRNDLGIITVRKGREIIIDPPSNADEASLRFSIISFALASILQHRGLLVFHASAVAINDKAALFLGRPGSGKSTIAAAMHSIGYRVLSDEITAVKVEDNIPSVLSGLPCIRLVSESARYLGHDPNAMPLVKSNGDKRVYSAKRGFEDGDVQLKRIYVLRPGDENILEQIRPQEAFHKMIENYYTARLLMKNMAQSHLEQCAKVISTVDVKNLSRADGLSHLPDLINLVKMDMLNDQISS